MMITVPGKVFIMGEYTVIDGSSEAIIAPTKRALELTLEPSNKHHYLSSIDLNFEALDFNTFIKNHPSKIFKEVYHTFKETFNVKELPPFKWHFKSSLDDQKKAYGLGSSGAFRVAVVKGMMAIFNLQVTDQKVFEMALMSQRLETSSYGDLAISSYGHSMIYQKQTSMTKTKITPVMVPEYVIINTGVKVVSKPFVDAYLIHKNDPFMIEYRNEMQRLVSLYKQSETTNQLKIIEASSKAYIQMALKLHPDIITKEIVKIIQRIDDFKGIAKVSGAGGGDNVLAFFDSKKNQEAFIQSVKNEVILL
jgi:phosphomevalonate kinase